MFVNGNDSWALHPFGMSDADPGFDSSGIFRTAIGGSSIVPPPPIASALVPIRYVPPAWPHGSNFWRNGGSSTVPPSRNRRSSGEMIDAVNDAVNALNGLSGIGPPGLPGAKLFGRTTGATPPPMATNLPSIPAAIFGGKKKSGGPLPSWMASADPSSANFFSKKSIFLTPQSASPGPWSSGSVLRNMAAVLRPSVPTDDTKAVATSLFGSKTRGFVSANSIPQAQPIAPPSPAVLQAAQVVATLPAVTQTSQPQSSGGGGGGGGGYGPGDQAVLDQAAAMTDEAPPVGWWAGLSTMMKVGVVGGGLGVAYLGYKRFARGGHSAGHKS